MHLNLCDDVMYLFAIIMDKFYNFNLQKQITFNEYGSVLHGVTFLRVVSFAQIVAFTGTLLLQEIVFGYKLRVLARTRVGVRNRFRVKVRDRI